MPQVTILEGGKPKSFAGVGKLQIALSGGGTSLWVPKDERLLTALTANVNGTYPPPEDYYGFDTVIVDVPPSQVAGIDPDTGQYVLIGTKPSKPGDDDYPVWPTDPTVPDDPWDPDTEGGNDWGPYEVPDGGDWTPPWDEPSSEWPDEDVPEMVETHIPSSIKIVKPPNKTEYTAGEAMDYTGIRVQLLDEKGQPFSNERYANTFIPYSELVFPIPYSPHAAEVDWESDLIDGKFPTYKLVTANVYMGYGQYVKQTFEADSNAESTYWTLYGPNRLWWIDASSVPAEGLTSNATYNGKTVYFIGHNFLNSISDVVPSIPYASDINYIQNNSDKIAWTIIYGKLSGNNAIPVQWVSPYDNKTYTDKFPITVTDITDNTSDPEGGGGGFSGGGGEGIGGEGGGGGF